MVESIEGAIVAQLKSNTNVSVEAFPSNPDDFKRLPLKRNMILVAYSGSSLSEPTNMDVLIQERILDFTITLQVRDLRGHEGAYPILEMIRDSLSGFSPRNDRCVMFMTNERLLQNTGNVWIWSQNWQLSMMQS